MARLRKQYAAVTAVDDVAALVLTRMMTSSVGLMMMLGFGPASEWPMWPFAALLSPFAALFYAVSVLSAWMRWIAHALPPSYVFEAMRRLLSGGGFPSDLLLRGTAVAAFELLAAASIYGRVYRRAVCTGLLARYSAEGST